MASPINSLELKDCRKAWLFDSGGAAVFAIADGAAVPQLLDYLYGVHAPTFECLYRGDLAPDMAEVAPYLIKLEADAPFTDWLLLSTLGKPWGVFFWAPADLRILRQHFRRFLTVYHQDTGKPLVFRFYDPRVLRAYLPSCNAEELTGFFGPVSQFLVDSDDPQTPLEFQLASGALKTNQTKLLEISDALRRPRL